MEIELWCVGKTTEAYIQQGLDIYTKKLSHFTNFRIRFFKEAKGLKEFSTIRQFEGTALIKELNHPDIISILLDERGLKFDSIHFAKWIEQFKFNQTKKLCFIIGGAFGFSDEVKNKATFKLSFSEMTFTHQIIRLILMEQIYRAFTISNNLPYHNE